MSENLSTAHFFGYQAANIAITGREKINGYDSAYFNWVQINAACYFYPSYTRQGETYRNRFPNGPVAV